MGVVRYEFIEPCCSCLKLHWTQSERVGPAYEVYIHAYRQWADSFKN